MAFCGENPKFTDPLAATRHKRNAVLLHCRLRHSSSISLIAVGLPGSSSRSSGVFAAHPLTYRLLSTSTPPGTTNAAKDTPQPIPAAVPASRKPKVELRPGPIKPAKPPHTPTESTSATPKPAASAPTASTSSSSSSSSSSKPESLIESTKHDLEDASQHGILAPPPADASWAGKLWHQAKELFKFYWRGIKLIATNRRRVRVMEERVKTGGPPLSRWETKFIRTNKQDTLKLIPFLLMILIIEEIIPLVVLYAPFILPSTCLLPSQKDRIDTKRREKQRVYALNNKPLFEQLRQRLLANPATPTKVLDSSALTAVNGLLALSTMGPNSVRLRRLQQHLASIAEDDILLKRESFGQMLTQAALRDALEERGIITDGLSPQVWQSRLEWWLKNAEGDDAFGRRVLLVASSGAGKF